MVKEIIIAITPRWCKLIFNGLKTTEIRKTFPKNKGPFKVYVYLTKNFSWLNDDICDDTLAFDDPYFTKRGKVIGEFVCDDILSIGKRGINNNFDYCYCSLNVFGNDDIEPYITAIEKSCVDKNELNAYGKDSEQLYAWSISDAKLYDEPKNLKDFADRNGEPMTKAPQGWQYTKQIN